jgi:hypothetical protein
MTCCFAEAWNLVFLQRSTKKIHSRTFRLIFRHKREKKPGRWTNQKTVLRNLMICISQKTAYLFLWSSYEGESIRNRSSTHGKHLKWTQHCIRKVLMENGHWGENILLKTFGICVRTSTGFIWLSLFNTLVQLLSGIFHSRYPNKVVKFPSMGIYSKNTRQAPGSTQSPIQW